MSDKKDNIIPADRLDKKRADKDKLAELSVKIDETIAEIAKQEPKLAKLLK